MTSIQLESGVFKNIWKNKITNNNDIQKINI